MQEMCTFLWKVVYDKPNETVTENRCDNSIRQNVLRFITRHLEMLTYGDTVQLIRAGMNYNHEYLIVLARSFVYLASRELCQLFHHSSHASRGSLADTYMHLLYFIYFISSIS